MKILVTLISLILLCANSTVSPAQKKKADKVYTVKGEGEAELLGNMTKEQAKQKALEAAKINALENEFGTSITAENTLYIENDTKGNGVRSNTSFRTLASLKVNGQWIETTDKTYTTYKEGENIFFKCKVKGKARMLKKALVKYEAYPMDCRETQCKTQAFNNGQDLFLLFKSPVAGYLSVYLLDQENAYRLLPYKRETVSYLQIEADKEYILFSKEHDYQNRKHIIDEYQVFTTQDIEVNQIYVIFSPAVYFKPDTGEIDQEKVKAAREALQDNRISIPAFLSIPKFEEWLVDNRLSSSDIQLKIINIDISK